MDRATTTVFIIVLVSHAHAQAAQTLSRSSPQCAYHNTDMERSGLQRSATAGDIADQQPALEIKVDPETGSQVVVCAKATNFCYALWKEDEVGNQTIISQGCWEISGKQECEHETCEAHQRHSRAHPNTKFCCCASDMCNANVTDTAGMSVLPTDEQPQAVPAATNILEMNRDHTLMLVAAGSCVLFLMSVLIIVLVWKVHVDQHKHTVHHLQGDAHLLERACDSPTLMGYSPEHLKLIQVVGQGRYGCVWQGTLREQDVAVKIFPGHYRSYFCNERDIYTLPFMDHPSLLTYFGCDERAGPDGGTELLLVLSYAPLGCLQDYLRHTAPDWAMFCRMSSSIAAGLAHLHTDIKKGDETKPCVSHRDLNSRNILVKVDLSCCICDLGLAMKIAGSKYYCNGEEQRAETKSINDVGTLRYMAPEVLEGAVNLRDCESSLKQIDVYALGLVLWEIASRCPDLYATGLEAPPYRLPFEAEIGIHPSFEQMQVLVSRHKARPLLPESWRDTPCVRLLRETIEDCWDQDAEARLTALCVDERLRELPTIWDRHRGTIFTSGVSPTVNATLISSSTINNNNNNNNNNNSHLHCTLDNRLHLTLPDFGEENGVHSGRRNAADKEGLDSTVSEGTVETLVTLSPSEPMPDPSCKNAQLANSQQMPCALQPYQGRNPCLERNLMTLEPIPQLLPNGNTLVDFSAALVDDAATAESHSLLAHDSLQHNSSPATALRPATPIPYVQNAVFEADPPSGGSVASGGCPKQPNVPGNGRRSASRWSWLLGGGMRLRLFSDSSSARRKLQQQQQQNRSSTGSALLLRDVGHAVADGGPWEDEVKSSNLSRSPPPNMVSTKVSLQQGSTVGTSVCARDKSVNQLQTSPTIHQRPSSLALASPDWLKTRAMRPPSSHIKTPKQNAPSGRFSLYDDRIMSQQLVLNPSGRARETRATSVPGDMNC